MDEELLGAAYELFSANDKRAYRTILKELKAELPASDAAGVYILRIYSPKGVAVKKLAKL